MSKFSHWVAVAAMAAVIATAIADTTSPAEKSLQPDTQQSRTARVLAQVLPQIHLTREPCGDETAAAAFDIFINSLDYEHAYFLASDIEEFRAKISELDDQLKTGELQFPFEVYRRFMARVEDRIQHVETLLKTGFTYTEQETFVWKRKDAPWPKDDTEWNELWRKKIKNELLGRLVNRTLAEEEAAARTNETAQPPETAQGETAQDEIEELPADKQLTPEQAVLKNYQQYLILLKDNESSWVVDRYLNAFAQAYDPHSDYMSTTGAEDFDISMRLSLVGIGALLSSEDGAAKVERLIPGGPAERDGRLKPGDKIIAVAQGEEPAVDVLHWPLNKTVRLIRGEKNTKVVLTVIPAADPSGSTTKKIAIVRDEVKLEEQAAKGAVREMVGADGATNRFGVITLPEFYADMSGDRTRSRTSAGDVRRIVEELKTNHIQGILLDLRNNGGGSLQDAIEITGVFIESGPVVQVKDQRRLHILSDNDPAEVYDGPLVVLVNRMSASASEILAAALQDYGRAVIVGDTKTHGKGTVQTLSDLRSDNPQLGKLKVTTASFYRIAGGSTQLNGVKPDIVIPSMLDAMELGEEYLPHALKWSEVYEAFYQPVEDLRDEVLSLREKSDQRRNEDERFQAYSELLSRLSTRQKSKEITLNMDERLALARSEKELQNLLNDKTEAKGKDGEKNDLVLNESLSILRDLTKLEAVASSENDASVAHQGG